MSPPPSLALTANQSFPGEEGEGERSTKGKEGRRRLPLAAAAALPAGTASYELRERLKKGGRGRRRHTTGCPSEAPCINGKESEERNDVCGACTSVRQRRDCGGITKEHINLYTHASGSDGAAYLHNAMV
jgi:hypothetical protein